MNKKDRKYVLVLVGALLLAVGVEFFKPEPLDWTFSFERDDQRPYGSLILFEVMPDLFEGVEAVNLPPYLVMQDTTRTGINYLFITDTFAPDPVETEDLMAFAARGNTVFVAAHSFSGSLADTLRLGTDYFLSPPSPSLGSGEIDSVGVNFVSPSLQAPQDYIYKEGAVGTYFDRFDTLRTTVLGVNGHNEANYVRLEVGAGAFYLSTVPLAFTNYYLLDDENADYVYRALSYLPPQAVLWDAYYKPNRSEATTPLRFVLRDPALKWAYGVLVALVLLLVVFEAKRRQRIIPIIEPLRNTTLEFVRTVGRLYYQHGDHANLAEKKISYLLDYIRTHLRLPTGTLDDDFFDRVAERAGVPADDVQTIFAHIRHVKARPTLSEIDLQRLNTLIESFYRKSQR